MMGRSIQKELAEQLDTVREQGLYKSERILESAQGAFITVNGKRVRNFCANNYLGLADHPLVIEAASQAMQKWGFGLSSVRFICGTQELHKQLEKAVSQFLGMEDSILFSSCFDANGALFEPLLDDRDAVISDELNHASIIDGVRLCKARRLRYRHSNMDDLERQLVDSRSNRRRLICTDGVFSMDGDIARLREICTLAEQYEALVMVDDSHATGYIGSSGRGTAQLCGVESRVDIITTTFGKALGGASGGCISSRKEIIELFRQRSRPYLFSNTLAPAISGGTLQVIHMIGDQNPWREKTIANAHLFRHLMTEAGFDLVPGETAIVPVMLYDERAAVRMADELLGEGVYVIGFSYPVVPKGKARIRVQLSAAHEKKDVMAAVQAFITVRDRMNHTG